MQDASPTIEHYLLTYGMDSHRGQCEVFVNLRWGVAVARQREQWRQASLTNMIEVVAAEIQRKYFTDGDNFLLIEHYPESAVHTKLGDDGLPVKLPTFDLVSLNRWRDEEGNIHFSQPRWHRIDQEITEKLLGGSLDSK